MAEAVALAKIAGTTEVDEALGQAATYSRFATGDLASILAATHCRGPMHRADEQTSLAQGTAGWAALGATTSLNGTAEPLGDNDSQPAEDHQ